jgi:hypothetical protein
MNSSANDDVVLLWRLLQLTVQQRGRVYGPDMAALLMDDLGGVAEQYACLVRTVTADGRQTPHDQAVALRYLCAGGHLREALAHAQRHNMWPEALFFAYKLGDYRVFDRFAASFPLGDPVRTVAQLLSGVAPDVHVCLACKLFTFTRAHHFFSQLKPPMQPSSESGDSADEADDAARDSASADKWWRAHAAVLLANMGNVGAASGAAAVGGNGQQALMGVYELAGELARAGRVAAADVCLMCVHLLSGWDVFAVPSMAERAPHHIMLLHATDTTRDMAAVVTTSDHFMLRRYSLCDVQATCVYDYAVRLAGGEAGAAAASVGVASAHFWHCRLHYAHVLAEYGLHDDAMTFCYQLASALSTVSSGVPEEAIERLKVLVARCVRAFSPIYLHI